MKTFKMNLMKLFAAFGVAIFAGGLIVMTLAPITEAALVPGTGTGGGTGATVIDDSCNQGFLGFPSWYRGLVYTKNTAPKPEQICDIKSPNSSGGLSGFIWKIALNVVEMAVVAAAYLSGFMFLFGGWMFIISRGNPEGAVKARSIMTMAALGLVLTVSAVTLVNFIVDKVIV